MRVIITGASTYGVKNAGDDAMLQVLCEGLKRKYPKIEIIFLARHPDKKFDKIFDMKSIKNIDHNSNKESIGRWFYGFNPGDKTVHLKNIRKMFEKTDLLIIGGNSFMELASNMYMRGVSSYSGFHAMLSRIFEKPYALYGVHGHAIQDNYTKQLAKFLCHNASLVTIRENQFRKELIKIKVNPKNLKVYTDPVFGINPSKGKELGEKILKNDKIKLRRKNIGVCFRHMYWLWNKKQYDHYSTKMAKLCDYMIKEFNANIVFIPNCTYEVGHKFEDDRIISKQVLKKMKSSENASIIESDLNLPERLAVYPLLDMVITNRRHVAIFSAVHHVPFISISTGHLWQFSSFLNDLKMSKQLINLPNEDFQTMTTKIKLTWKNRNKISRKLSKTVPVLSRLARKQVDDITKLLK